MERRMLINTAHSEECRIAIVDDQSLVELEVESNAGRKLKGNIYKAKISRIEPSLQAAFVDIGTSRNGFLQINDIHPSFFRSGDSSERGHPRIQDVLEPGQELVVQVVKEEREQKGATLTTFLSLPGRYVVLMAGSERGGVSRKISDSEQRQRLKKLMQELEIPAGLGVIIRTAGLNRSHEDLSRDLSLQLKLWEQIVALSQSASCPTLLYKESDLTTRVIRDYFTPEIREIVIDDDQTFQKVKEFIGQVMPRYRSRVKLFSERQPIFSHYGIEDQILSTFKREVKLPSGGTLLIDPLEALVAIDVNSGKATAGEDIEETAFRTNLEAAEEACRQLRLRDLGGLIVIDFIDMLERRHKSAVEQRVRDALKLDKARVEVGRLSRFGLLEMSRQRLRASLTSQSHVSCPSCQGMGKFKSPEIVALEVLRKIQTAIIVGHVKVVKTRLAPVPAFFLLNNKKRELVSLEQEFGASVFILADGRLAADEYEFQMESGQGGTQVVQSPAKPAPRVVEEEEEFNAEEKPLRGALRDGEKEEDYDDEEEPKAAKQVG